MTFHSRNPSFTRHRSWSFSESLSSVHSLEAVSPSPERIREPSVPPELVGSPDGCQETSVFKKSKSLRKKSRKAAVLPVLVITGFCLLECWWLSSIGYGPLSSRKLIANQTTQDGAQSRMSYEPSGPMFRRLLGLAAHALAEGESKPEPGELWREPTLGSSKWRACANERLSGHLLPPEPKHSTGYIVISADGGLNQQRVAICNAVAVARLLNATLVLPRFLFSDVWADSSQFGDIYEEDFFVNYLKDDVHIVSELPLELQSLDLAVIGSVWTNIEVPKESKPSFFMNVIRPVLLRNRVVHFEGFANALTFDPIPFDIQRLRCRCNYHALQFRAHIRRTAGIMIRRMREGHFGQGRTHNLISSELKLSSVEEHLVGSHGLSQNGQIHTHLQSGVEERNSSVDTRYLGLHLRFEMDMAAYSLCEFGGGDLERQELKAYRDIHFPTLSKHEGNGKLLTAAKLRERGRCPLTPEEAALILAALGFKRSTRIFLAGAHIYGGQARMAPITNLYPNVVTKEDLLTAEELSPFINHSSQLAALDFIGCATAEAFAMTDSGSQLSSLVSGYRIYYGAGQHPTIRPNKQRLAKLFLKNTTLEWEAFEESVRKTMRESKRQEERPLARSVYRHPRCKDCMCH